MNAVDQIVKAVQDAKAPDDARRVLSIADSLREAWQSNERVSIGTYMGHPAYVIVERELP